MVAILQIARKKFFTKDTCEGLDYTLIHRENRMLKVV